MIDRNNLKKKFTDIEKNVKIIGWDFSYLDDKTIGEETPWSYKDIILSNLTDSKVLLDIGTGGGEFLLSLNHPYENTYVTEGYEPNYLLCKERLSPLGIKVIKANGEEELPFNDNTFDIICNRHESYNIKEIKRLLKPNGLFITQQVGSMNNRSMSKLVVKRIFNYNSFTLEKEVKKFINNEFTILYKNEALLSSRYLCMEAVIFMCKVIEWEFPNFSVDKCFKGLKIINKQINQKGYYESKEHRFIIVCKNVK